MSRKTLFPTVAWGVTAAGAAIAVCAAARLPLGALDVRFLVLTAVTLCVTSRVTVVIPRVKSSISVSDTLIFLTMILYGGEAAILLNAAESALTSSRYSKSKLTVAYNAGAISVATLATVAALRLCFGGELLAEWGHGGRYVTAICLMALIQYAANSGLVALGYALKNGERFWPTWHRHYLWTSITYFAGASAASLIAFLMRTVGAPALIFATPVVVVVYFTYRTYLKNVETSNAQAEQARRHVEELSHYIAEQERIREQYAQIEKLSALGELASGVAHDFNNTLAGILGRAQLLMRTRDPEKLRSGLEIIARAAEDGAHTVRRIQDFARQRRDHDFQPVSVDQLLLDVREITRARWKDSAAAAGVQITLDLRLRSSATVLGDGSELREVLVNMIFNAVDAMPRGGRLTLTSDEEDGRVVLSVSDTGTGMTPEVSAKVFDPFFTTKGKAGMGLGLSVSYGIIRRHEGSVKVESEVGRGTTFRILLPAAGREAQPAPEAPAPSEPARTTAGTRPIRILVAEDERDVRELLCEILRAEGHEVYPAASGVEALELFRASHFDAVFTDIGMPGMSGWELARAVRETDGSVPLAVITGWGDAVGSAEQRAACVDWVVTKPFDADRIAELAADASHRRHAAGQELALVM
ncbi:MAG TPA: ATP-binding protein [Pyrinomonadaceae bacterium]|jgi:signal transduction histidine kinase/ActR/RegA family two-component response regulator